MKTIALFGATGQTGKEFLSKVLTKGYQVKALVRSPQKVAVASPQLHLVEGNVLEPADVEQTVEGAEVVVSLFGHVKDSPAWLQSRGTENIIKAMKRHQVRKIISLSGGGLAYEKDKPKLPDYLIRGVMRLFVPKILNDAKKHALVLKRSELDWVVVRAPRLTNEPEKGNYRIGWVGVNASTKIGRADLADFILKQVEDEKYLLQMPFVSY